MRTLRLLGLALAVIVVTLAVNGSAGLATPAALTVTPISWTVVGLDSNSPSTASLPHIYPVGARVCNTGSVSATNVSAKWTWGDTTGTNTVDGAFSAPAQNTTQTIGTLAGGGCQDVYFNVDVKQSGGNSSKTHSQNQNIIATADGGLSASETKLVYVEGLVSQNRNQVKAWSGAGGCNLTFTTCDPAPTHIYVGQTYTYKLYAQTSTAYDELEAFATWPSFVSLNSARETLSTVSAPGSGSSTSIWADSCTWGSMTSSSSGACGTAGKAGGSVVVTYKITPTAAGTATAIQPMIYDHSGSSFHYNSGYTTSLEAVEADWKLSASVTGNGMVTSTPNGFTPTGASAPISCGTTGTTCDVGYAANTSVTLTATPGSGQTFTGWSGGSCTGTATTCTVTMNQARSVTAAFTGLTYYPLAVTKYGSGTVTAGDSSISCGSTCSASYASGTSVTLTAAASANWQFSGWSGDCASSGTSPTCVVSMSQSRSVTATFTEKTYTLTVSATGTGAGGLCSNNSNQANSGLCSPGSESVFISCGSSTSTTNYTDTICSGTFPAGQTETLYPMCNGGTSGTPCPGGSGASTVSFGGYTGGTCSGNATTGCAITMDQDRTVNANFVLGNTATPDLTIAKSHSGSFSQGDTGKTYTLTVSNVGTGASYTGKTITVTDTPPTGLTITGMSGTGWTCTVATKTCTQTLSSNLAAGASLNAITVTVSVASNASTPLANVASVACSASCTDDTSNDSASDSTTILTPSDLTITKSHSGSFTQGSTGDWTLTATNSGGQATSGAVTVTDPLPSGFTKSAITGSGWDCSASTATNVSCTRSDALAATSSYPAIDITANIGATAVTATNTASVSGGGETNTANDSASDPTTVVTSLNVALAGTGSGSVADDLSSIGCGSTCSATYNTNTVVTLTATPATGSTFTGWSGAIGSCTASATTCQVTMSQARSITAMFALQTFTLQVTTSGTGTGTVTSDVGGISCNANLGTCSKTYSYGTTVTLSESPDGGSTLTAWSGGCTPSGATCAVTMTQNASVGAQFDLGTSPLLTVSKSHLGNFHQGDTGDHYTVSVANSGTGASSGTVTVTDSLPTGLTPTGASGTGWSCGVSGQTVTCTRSDALAASASYAALTVTVNVASDALSSVTNTVSVSGGGCASSPCGTASDPTTIVQDPRLAISKSHTGSFHQGDTADGYTISVSNGSGTEVGPTTGAVTVADTMPTGLTPATAAGTGWNCSIAGQTITCTRSDSLARGASYPSIAVTAGVASDAASSLTNTATVAGGGCTSSPCATASDPTSVGQDPRLAIAKSHSGTFHQGDTGDGYTISVSNGSGTEVGPTSGAVTVTDAVPTGLSPTGASGTGWSCGISGQTVTCTRTDALARGASYPSIGVTVNVASDALASLTNSASVAGGGCTSSPCGTASDPTTIVQDPRLAISKSHTGNFHQGETGDTYTLSVSNGAGTEVGPTTGTVTVTDAVPAGLTPTAASGTGWSCGISGQTVTCTRSDALARGASYPAITLTVNVASNATSLTNTATVSGGGCTASPCASASDPTTVGQDPRLAIAKSHTGSFHQGDTGDTYSLSVSNGAGVSVGATSGTVTVADPVPSGLTPTAASGTGWTCGIASQTVTCTRSDALAAGASYPAVTVTVNVAPDAPSSVTNTASVSGGGCTSSPCASASDPTTIVQDPRLAIAKSHTGSFHQGDTGDAYTITVANGSGSEVGPTRSTVTVTDAVPSGLTPTGAAGTGWTCGIAGQTVTCTRSDVLARGASYSSIAVTVNVAAGADASVTNTASVSGGGCTSSPCGMASDPTTIVQDPRLAIAKSHSGTFHQGDSADTYAISVSNGTGTDTGPTRSTVTVTDNVPLGLTPTGAAGTGWSCGISGQTVTCTRSDVLARGMSYPDVTVAVGVASDASSSVTNTASVSGGGCTASPCGAASDPTTIVQDPRLAIAKSHTGSFHQRDTGDSYTISVSNGSGSEVGPTRSAVTVVDAVPAGLTPTAASGIGWSCAIAGQTVTCTRSDVLARGASYPDVTVTVDVAVDASASVTNTATVSGGGCTASPCGTASDPTTIVQDPRLAIAKSHTGTFDQRDTGDTYSIAVSNGAGNEVGPTRSAVTVTDPVPAGLTPTGASGTGWNCSVSGQTVTCSRSDALARGASYPAITVSVDVAANADASVTNTASVDGGGCVASPCATASDPTTIVQDPRLSISKTHTGSFRQRETGDRYTISVANGSGNEVGPTRSSVTVTDAVPAGLTPTAASGAGWTCSLSGQTVNCSRADVLARGASYPDIGVSVDVSATAPGSLTNTASVAGGGCAASPCDNASDPTTIVPRYDLHAATTGSGSGSVSSDVGSVSCGATCTDTYDGGTNVTLTAAAANGSTFLGWTGDCSGSSSTCTVAMDRARDVSAAFGRPELHLTKTALDSLRQGDTGDRYDIAVSNGGDGPTTSDVSVVEHPPAGLTVTSMSGTGWTCDLPSLSCVRSDALAPGGTYPSVRVLVDVADDADPTLTNVATVSGGGCTGSPCDSGSSAGPVAREDGSISGRVFDHSTPGAPGLQGWTVYLDRNGNGAPDTGEPSTTTDAAGAYRFSGLARGAYDVREVLADGWTCATPAGCDYPVSLGSNASSTGSDFGNDAPPVPAPTPDPTPAPPVVDKPPLTVDVPAAPAAGGASISGTVYNDLNADGVRQSGEPGLAGWRVGVDLDGDGRLGAGDVVATTDANGAYLLSGLTSGSYTVIEVAQAGWTCSDPTPCTHSVTTNATDVDFGDWAHALLRGHQYEDANRDGVHQANEAPLGGWTVYVDYNDNGRLDPGEPSSVTRPDGYYGITAVAAGTWTVREVARPDWTCSGPANCSYRLTFDASTELGGEDFLDWAPARATGTVWDDLSADTIRDPGDPGLGGWIVYVDYNGDGTLDDGDISTTTNAQGDYSMGVKPGTWTVREVKPAHWICDVPTPCTQTGTYASGSTVSGDFGNYRLAMLSGTMFDDLDRNGVQNVGEPGLGGWKVYVDYNHNGRWDRGEPFDMTNGGTTGARGLSSAHGIPGHYTITGIEPGSWTIREVRHNGFPCTFPFTCLYGQHFLENSRIVHRDFATFKPTVRGSVGVVMPDTCVAGGFTVRVTTSALARLEVDARPGVHRVLTGHGAKREVFVVRLNAAPTSVGAHPLVIRATFTQASGTRPKRVVRMFYRCGTAPPPFTG